MLRAVRKLLARVSNREESTSGASSDGNPTPAISDGGVGVERIATQDFGTATGSELPADLAERQAEQLAASVHGEADPATVTALAREGASAGVDVRTYASLYERASRAAVERAFDDLEAGTPVEEARASALEGVSTVHEDLQRGLGAFESDAGPVTVDEVIKAFPMSAILIEADHSVVAYTGRLMGLDDDHSEFVGRDCRETIAVATYSDRSRANTLADKVAENPRDAHDHWDVERTDDENTLVDFPVYRDTSVSKNQDGVETHIDFVAVPIFDREGELKAVFELIEDATEDVLRDQDLVSLIEEVSATLGAIGDGDLSARADWADDHGLIESRLGELPAEINEMADSFEELIRGVDEKRRNLEASIEQLTGAADRIDGKVDDQTSSLDEIAGEVEALSATMEEIAANASEVTEAAERAQATAEEGVEAGEGARESTLAVEESTQELVGTVERLGEQMTEISEVVEIISDIAEQTNMLALNANIEAARADQSGDGFAVVADEVKTLATETQEYADDIASRVEEIETQADRTIEGVEQSHVRVTETRREIENVLDSLAAIADEVEDAAVGMTEVAEANDDQAARVEEVTAIVEEVQQRAHDVADTTGDVVEAAENQRRVADDLSRRIDDLR